MRCLDREFRANLSLLEKNRETGKFSKKKKDKMQYDHVFIIEIQVLAKFHDFNCIQFYRAY